MLTIDGSYGEGGGQILRSALTLATILYQPLRIENIRAGRKNPGLAAQHLTAVRAAAMICDAQLTGDALGSTSLTFEPQSRTVPGLYAFDVAEAREGGSAGAVTLVLQTILLPLALADGPSSVTVRGGTHVAWSPSLHYFRDVYLPTVAGLGVEATVALLEWGWYPAGEGEVHVEIPGGSSLSCEAVPDWTERGELEQISGLAVASSLPSHIAQRMCNRTINLLDEAGLKHDIQPRRVRSTSPGAGIFLTAEYENSRAGFTALGRKGKPSEQVAQEAVDALLDFHHSQAVLDEHLADQLLLPLALAGCQATLRTGQITTHTRTNLWLIEQFLGPQVRIDEQANIIEFFQP